MWELNGAITPSRLLYLLLLVLGSYSYDFGACPDLQDPIGVHPTLGTVVTAGQLVVSLTADHVVVVKTVCDESSGWILTDNRFSEVRCSYDARRQKWSWSHQHRDMRTPPLIRCSHFSPRPIEQSYTLVNYTGCHDDTIRTDLVKQVTGELESSLECCRESRCLIPSVQCRLEGESSKLSVVVKPTMLGSLEEQLQMLSDAGQFLKEFKPVYSSGHIIKRELKMDWNDTDPDDSTLADCGPGQITKKINETYSYCVDCNAGMYAEESNQTCVACPYDCYSESSANEQCTPCSNGTGTLTIGSDSSDNCIAVCVIPDVGYTSSMEPAARGRVVEGGNVTLHCDTGYFYGNLATTDVTCETNQTNMNNFPSSCRRVTVTAPKTSIVEEHSVSLDCTVASTDTGPNTFRYIWIKDGSEIHSVNSSNNTRYTISSFLEEDAGSYSCRADYATPLRDEVSASLDLSLLDVRVAPDSKIVVYSGEEIKLSCTMRIDSHYPKRSIEWVYNLDKINSGISTNENNSSYMSVLTLDASKVEDTGSRSYYCYANYSNLAGNDTVTLDGYFDVIVRGFTEEAQDVSVTVGEEFNIRCSFFAEMEITFTWQWDKYSNGTREDISNNSNINIATTMNSTSSITTSTLTVDNATLHDAGDYICNANLGGANVTLNSSATVSVYDMGVVSSPVDAAYLVGEDATLSCTAKLPGDASHGVSVKWARVISPTESLVIPDEKVHFDSTTGVSTLTLLNVSVGDAGGYKCQATYITTQISFDSTVAELFVREMSESLDEYTLVKLSSSNQMEVETASFTCTYHGDGNVGDVTWTLDGRWNSGLPAEYQVNTGSYNNSTRTWTTSVVVSPVEVSSGGRLACNFNFSNVGTPVVSTTNFIIHSLRELEEEVLSSDDTVNVTCQYTGTDSPDITTWSVNGALLQGDETHYTIIPGQFTDTTRIDVLTVSGRSYSDSKRNITCKYSFTNPQDELQTSTLLIYRGMHSGLQPAYYLTEDSRPLAMECYLGVGSDGVAPPSTKWYWNGVDLSYMPANVSYWNISTDASPKNGLFKSSLSVSEVNRGISGNYSCEFVFTPAETYSSNTILHTRMVHRTPPDEVLYGYSPLLYPIACYVDSDEPPANVSWTGPKGPITEGVHTITIDNTTTTIYMYNITKPTVEDSGAYTCQFNFLSGPSVEGTFPDIQFREIKILAPSRLYVTSGVNVTLECKVDSHKLLELGWYDIYYEDFIAPTTLTYDNRTTVARLTLSIRSVDDAGQFLCVKSEAEYSRNNVTFVVLGLSSNFSNLIVGDEDEELTLACSADYNNDITLPSIKWFQDGDELVNGSISAAISDAGDHFNSYLKVNVTSKVDGKKFHCVATYSEISAASDLVSNTTTIVMTKIEAEHVYKVGAVGDTVTFTCNAYSKQDVEVSWRRTVDGSVVDLSEYSEMLPDTPDYLSISVLKLYNVTMETSSESIQCWFDPGITKTADMTLNVIDVATTGVEVVRGRHGVLRCSANSSFDVPLITYWTNFNGTTEHDEPEFGVSGQNDTTYTCNVRLSDRSHGVIRRNASYNVFDIIHPVDVIVEVSDVVELSCGVSEHEGHPSFSWYKEGESTQLNDNFSYNYTFAPTSSDDSGDYYCNVSMLYDGLKNGPFKSKSSTVTVRDVRASFTETTLIGESEEVHLKLECSYTGDDSVITVQWETPVGNFTESDLDHHLYNITTSGYSTDGGVTSSLETRKVEEDDKYRCAFIMGTGRPIRRGTTLTLYRFSELKEYTYNPTQLLVNYKGEIEPNVTWYIADNQYDETRDIQYTPSERKLTNNTKEFKLEVDMTKFSEGSAPVDVKGKFSFESFPAVNESVSTRIFKREIIKSLEKYVKVTESDATFTCVAAGENDQFSFSWYTDEAILNDSTPDVIIADEAVADSSYSRKSTIKINNINQSPDYNGQLRCVATWEDPELFSLESVSDLDTVGASMSPIFNTANDGSAVLTCLVWGNDPPTQVTWTDKESKEVEHVDKQVLIRNVTQDAVHVHTLTFVSVQLANEGSYTCTVTLAGDEEIRSLETELYFLGASFDPPSPYFVHDLSKDIEFMCVYRGFRKPKGVLWFRDAEEEGNRLENHTDYTITTNLFNDQLFTQESVMVFKRAGVESSGNYICKWETETLSVAQHMVVAVRILKTEEISYSTEGVISLQCHYNGMMEGTVRWYRESSEIVSGDTVNIITGNLTDNQQVFNLSISDVGVEEDAGEYRCVLSFEDGDKITATTEVIVRQGRILSDYWNLEVPLIYLEGDVLELQCLVEGDKVPAYVQWSNGAEISFDGRVNTINSNTVPLEKGVRHFSNVTLREVHQSYEDARYYYCKFTFSDGNNVMTGAIVQRVSVTTRDTCVFVDSRLPTITNLSCVFQGAISSFDGVGFELEGELVEENVSVEKLNRTTWEGTYKIVNTTSAASGVYKCAFKVDKVAEFSGTQRLAARKADLESSASRRLVGSTLTLTCTVTDGAKTITWYKNNTEFTSYKTLSRRGGDKGLTEQVTVSLRVEETSRYSCRGEIYDQFCPQKQHFDSNSVSLEALLAQPLQNPSNGFAYEGSSHEFRCQFPDGYKGEDYTYNVYWTFNDQRILSNGDVYVNGKRVIDGKISTSEDNNGGAGPDIIITSYEITSVDSSSEGYFACAISWMAGMYIKSDKARLTVRSITNRPVTTNVARGGDVTLSCTTTGDVAPNSITFYYVNGTSIDGAASSNTTDEGVVTTVAVVVLSEVTNTGAGFYYCTADWGDRTLDSEHAYLSVLSTRPPDSTEVWGVQGFVARMECQSDAALLRGDGDGDVYLDENGRVVYANADISWEYKDPSSADHWSTVGDVINHFVESPVIGPDGLRRSALSIGPILPGYNDLEFRCKVTYETDEDNNFYGGTVPSDGIKLKVSMILSFTILPDTPIIVGDTFNLVCTALGDTAPTFRLTNDGWSLDTSRYSIINNSTVVQNVVHIASYTVQTKEATVLLGGQDFHCAVNYGTGSGELSKVLKVTTYYDCNAVHISVLGSDPGVSITYEDDDGDRTAKVTCPADTSDTKYALHVTNYANETSTCTKDTGRYNPPYLATCLARNAFDSGKFQQVWTLTSASFTVCDDTSTGQYTKMNMTSTLTTNSSDCGPYPVVPCLKDDKCTLDGESTGCRWDDSTKKLYVFYKVNFATPVWTISERRALADLLPNTKLRFWDCPAKVQSPGRRSLSKSGVFLEHMSVDEESDMVYETEDGKNYNMLIVGLVGVVAVALAIGAFLYRRRRRVTRDDHVVIELTDRSLVMENRHIS